ncbi:hypothetical protein [Nonomuraea jabiensis]|uniref:Uncharacterized protein n=1 Tax=Nonomuraea jabiensis TaxID=882448 RepID=A0A7W9GC79_9ACTN|nr:hypothetical protein [Nonomuraea jabiensis]MBB5781096.1 hypothetical protein [Nonomuraea jabiensis]
MGDDDRLGQDITRVGRIIAQIVGPTTFIGSLLMYIGNIRLNTMYTELGVNTSMLSFTFQEYVIRSIPVADEPLAVALMVLLAAPLVHGILIRFTAWHRTALMRTVWVLVTLGAVSLVVALVAIADHWPRSLNPPPFAKPFFLSLGAILLVYSLYLYTRLSSGLVISSAGQIVQRTALVALLLLPTLWYMDDRARTIGRAEAKEIREHPEQRLVAVVVYASQRLNLYAPGIKEASLKDPNAEFPYQYTGLRLLIESNQQYFVVPYCWGTAPEARAIALPADGSIRLETLNVPRKQSCPKGR